MIANVLTIAGSDPSGGAGIQADLKTFSALGCYGMSVITALTAQNTMGVRAVHNAPSAFLEAQLEAIFADIRVDAVKIGMAGGADDIAVIAHALTRYKPAHVVLDPVMVATSGDRLIDDAAVEALKVQLLPLCHILTPNMPEAQILLGGEYDADDLKGSARRLLDLGVRASLLKGGHGCGAQSADIYASAKECVALEAPRIDTNNTHGTGCTLSSAIAANLAKGLGRLEACRAAKGYITEALRNADALDVGEGKGPVNHFHRVWD